MVSQRVKAYAVFPNNCGDLVAKLAVEKVAAVAEMGSQELTLEGCGGETVAHSGSTTIRVIKVGKAWHAEFERTP